MPSRQLPFPPPPFPPFQSTKHRRFHLIVIILAGAIAAISVITISIVLLFRRRLSIRRNATAPSDTIVQPPPPHRFSYSSLRRATSSFSASNRLGQGGFGSVYKATLPSGQLAAVKVMNVGSLQGEREFHNELSLSSNIDSKYVVSILGFSADDDDGKRCHRHGGQRMVLVYELMENGSLQDALFAKKCVELLQWNIRFNILNDIANGLMYLHNVCDPPVIHGDIKPSNVLLDCDFKAKLADFGVSRVKIEGDDDRCVDVLVKEECQQTMKLKKNDSKVIIEDNGSIIEEEDDSESLLMVTTDLDLEALPACLVEASPSEQCFDKISVDSGKDLNIGGRKIGKKKAGTGRDWWWKQDNVGGSESGRLKDYVFDWIGNEIKKEKPKPESINLHGASQNKSLSSSKVDSRKKNKPLEWWASLDEEKTGKKKKVREPRKWWKEEFCDELTRENEKKRSLKSSSFNDGELWWQKKDDEDEEANKKKRRKSRSTIDLLIDGLSGELRINGRRNSQDEIPKSGGISSTPSMRGTVCYIAPEYGGGGVLFEKCDVYSFGVLLLVLISGRRPLQVTDSPMSEFERANLISWAKQLARNGKLLDLVDPSIESLNQGQALLCITIALMCLQRSPTKRPSMGEIVRMLSRETSPPHLPFEFSPSPPTSQFKSSRKKAR